MARARNIKPGFFTNDKLAECEFAARLLFVGLWTIADCKGRLLDRPKKIRVEVFPYDSLDIEPLLKQLAQFGFIRRYTADGQDCIQIENFGKHQNPHKNEVDFGLPGYTPVISSNYEKLPETSSNYGMTDERLLMNDESCSMNHDSCSTDVGETGSEPPAEVLPTPDTNTPPQDETPRQEPLKAPPTHSLHLPSLNTLPKGFAAFWGQYPKQVSEPKARLAYDRAVSAIVAERSTDGWDIHRAIQWLNGRATTYAKAKRESGTPIRYILNPESFLDDKRYNDDDRTWREGADGRTARAKVADPSPSRGKLFDPDEDA